VVTDLTYHVTVEQVALNAHQDAMVQTADALQVILEAWQIEFNHLCQQQATVADLADSIDDSRRALEHADYVYGAKAKRLEYLKGNLAHYTRRLRELGLAD